MGKTVRNPKKFIVSCRVNDNEMEALSKLANEAGTNISDLLRQSILLLEQDLRASA
ncbi:plasmid mobilization protein [Trichloromonas sp.]|uniref:plasmid mobilization protein n=1 Tax=Trichloromonas sp. TaxID=3069249 RepID=UPI003D819E1E